MALQITLWGVRGSLPATYRPEYLRERIHDFLVQFEKRENPSQSAREFLEERPLIQVGGFGGHTSCAEVTNGQTQLIVDGGSGICRLGEKMMGGPCGLGKGEVHIFMTHFHWDHLIGLPFFIPLFVPGNIIHFYAVQPELEATVRMLFTKPFFPVAFKDLGAKFQFHRLEPRKRFQFGSLGVTPYMLDHPDPCWGFRIDNGEKTFSYCVDTETKRASPESLGEDRKLYENSDLLVFDAQYSLAEMADRIDWGHSAATMGLDLAQRFRIPKVVFVHHDPSSPDEKIHRAIQQTEMYYESQRDLHDQNIEGFLDIDWVFAYDGMKVTL